MMGRRMSLVLIGLSSMTAIGSPGAQGSAVPRTRCHVPHGRAVAASAKGVLVAVSDPGIRGTAALYACRPGHVRASRLEECGRGSSCGVSAADAKGCAAAYGWDYGDKSGQGAWVAGYNFCTG